MMTNSAKWILLLFCALSACGRFPGFESVVLEATVRSVIGETISDGEVAVCDREYGGDILNWRKFDHDGTFRISVSRPFVEPRSIQVRSQSYGVLRFPFVVPKGTHRIAAQVVLSSGSNSHVTTSNETLQAVIDIARERSRAIEAFKEKATAGEQPDPRELYHDFYRLAMAALDSDREVLRAYGAAQLLDSRLADVATGRDRRRGVEHLPVASAYWGWARALWSLPPNVLGPDGTEVLERVAATNRDQRVRAYAVAALARAAREEGNEATWLRRYEELESFADVKDVVPYLLKDLNPATKIAVGKPVPAFNLALMDGTYRGSDLISDETFRGAGYLLHFWGTWCAPCVAEMPKLHALWQKHGGTEFQILSLAKRDSPETVQRFRKELFSMPWLHVVLEGEAGQDTLELFEITATPTTILVDRVGTIVSLERVGPELERVVSTLVGR